MMYVDNKKIRHKIDLHGNRMKIEQHISKFIEIQERSTVWILVQCTTFSQQLFFNSFDRHL